MAAGVGGATAALAFGFAFFLAGGPLSGWEAARSKAALRFRVVGGVVVVKSPSPVFDDETGLQERRVWSVTGSTNRETGGARNW